MSWGQRSRPHPAPGPHPHPAGGCRPVAEERPCCRSPALWGAGQDLASDEGLGLAGGWGAPLFPKIPKRAGGGSWPFRGPGVGGHLPTLSLEGPCQMPASWSPRAQQLESQTLWERPAVQHQGQKEAVVISYVL